ncbi:hypothetical protein ACHAWF_005464, partial [Thalassiosira exigua]
GAWPWGTRARASRSKARLVSLAALLSSALAVGSIATSFFHIRLQARRFEARRALLGVASFADPRSVLPRDAPARDVHVATMCRCKSGDLPVPGRPAGEVVDTGVIQPPSMATGLGHAKRFVLHQPVEGEGCQCEEESKHAELSPDMFLKVMQRKCPADRNYPILPSRYDWFDGMPDLGVEETLPIFAGVLSYESPLSLNNTLHNWRKHGLFEEINARDVFVQLNHRSQKDDAILDEFQQLLQSDGKPPLSIWGSPEENVNPGLAIAKFCRAAESHPSSHPNGENLLLFLEKDWVLHDRDHVNVDHLEELFRSINALIQRGVSMVRLKPLFKEITWENSRIWRCPSMGVPWACATAHQHRWSNQPSVIDCRWFLRYLEPFALLDDPMMHGCRQSFQESRYVDWEEALQDGRVAWTNSQWVVAAIPPGRGKMFDHQEVDG